MNTIKDVMIKKLKELDMLVCTVYKVLVTPISSPHYLKVLLEKYM